MVSLCVGQALGDVPPQAFLSGALHEHTQTDLCIRIEIIQRPGGIRDKSRFFAMNLAGLVTPGDLAGLDFQLPGPDTRQPAGTVQERLHVAQPDFQLLGFGDICVDAAQPLHIAARCA